MPNEWISVKDKGPCVGSLVFESDGSVSIADEIFTKKLKSETVYFTQKGIDALEAFCSKGDVVKAKRLAHITHWMPLPEPPEGVDDNA